MAEASGRTVICSVAFLDIVGYSRAPDARQAAMKARLNAVVGEALKGVAEPDRIIIDTGDGDAICFFGDPEDALFTATAVTEAVRRLPGDEAFTLRVGINLGPAKVVVDLNGRPNVIGDAINVAQRVMSFADEGEILVSRSYYEVVSRLQDGNERLFRYLGIRKDKHVREHQVYAFSGADPHPCAAAPRRTELDEDAVAAVERRLADLIGPMARVIVSRAATAAPSLTALCEAVAPAVPDEADRAAFLDACLGDAGEEAAAAPAAPAPAAAPRGTALAPDALARAEHSLAELIGPLAPLLVRRAAKEAADIGDLYARLAPRIEDAAARRRFLAEAEKE